MKRWQDRGEVLDSDEEDLEFSNDSQSPEQPRKRQRLDKCDEQDQQTENKSSFPISGAQDPNGNGPAHEGGDEVRAAVDAETAETADDVLATQARHGALSAGNENDAEEAWMQPKVLVGYGRREARVPRATNSDRAPSAVTSQATSAAGPTVAAACGPSPAEADPVEGNDALGGSRLASRVNDTDKGTIHEATTGHRPDDAAGVAARRECSQITIDGLPEDDPDQEQPAPTEEPLFAPSSPMSSDDEGLPDLNDIFRRITDRPRTPASERQDDSSALSSALSSPEAPPQSSEFRLPRITTGVELPPAVDKSASVEVHSSDPPGAQNAATVSAAERTTLQHSADPSPDADANTGRRSLRTRTEKQLHPYVYDRTIYQQQWKQRGLRPVHFVLQERSANETQDHSYDTDESRSQEHHRQDSSQARSSELGVDSGSQSRPSILPDVAGSDDELPDIDTVLKRRPFQTAQDGHKRRKTSHPPQPGKLQSIRHKIASKETPQLRHDESSVPMSPPPTSSDSTRQHVGAALPSGFRLPYGMTPAPLPTPQVSSETRHPNADIHDSDSDMPTSRSRSSTLHKAKPRVVLVESSTESGSEADCETDLQPVLAEDTRLRRERKRIRGVLPASWLRIDIRAQQRPAESPLRDRRLSTSPPRSDRPTKGVAQKVYRRSATPSRGNLMDIGDSGDDDSSSPTRSPETLRQTRLQFDRDNTSTARDTILDDHLMEVDWIDPMVAGSSRRRHRDATGKKRQPKIKDAFRRVREASNDFSEEQAGLRFARGTTTRPRQGKQPRDANAARRKRSNRPSGPSLSILDMPSGPHPGEVAPQFVRLAQRQARRHTSLGRHSPSHKVLRLATKAETEEATAMLHAWREGTLQPRSTPELVVQHVERTADVRSHSRDKAKNPQGKKRQPLLSVTNQQNIQANLPSPLRTERQPVKDKSHLGIDGRRIDGRMSTLHQAGLDFRVNRESSSTIGRTVNEPEMVRASTNKRDDRNRLKPRFRVLPQDGRTRKAQLETSEDTFDTEHRSVAFERRMNVLTEGIARPLHVSRTQALPLDRFLEGTPPPAAATRRGSESPTRAIVPEHARQQQLTARQTTLTHRPRKRTARHVNAELREYRQPNEPLPEPIVAEDETVSTIGNQPDVPGLQGLGPFGTRYATDFDVRPLQIGTHFHQSTFIGSGELDAALHLSDRDLDTIVRGQIRIYIDDEVCEWGVWTEEVAEDLAKVPRALTKALQLLQHPDDSMPPETQISALTANIDHMLRSVVRYCSEVLVFFDPVDRRSCVQHLQRFVHSLLDALEDGGGLGIDLRHVSAKCHEYILVLASQVCFTAQHDCVPAEVLKLSQELKRKAAKKLSAHLAQFVYVELPAFYDDSRHNSKREGGIKDDCRAVASVVLLNHCLQSDREMNFWQVVKSVSVAQAHALSSVQALDKEWYQIYTLLPALEIDSMGRARPGERLHSTQQHWHVVKSLVDRLLELYPATSIMSGTTINEYLRATFTRCSHLITHWGWHQCEIILGTIFDFFARRMLAPLSREESRGSPRFLADLENQPSLEVQAEDRSFNIFLKMLATGLLNMRKYNVYSEKKIGSIAWRFVPNHSRSYLKEADVQTSNLDALRNHHDVLCTLYFACPPGCRIRLESVRNIVDHASWHREACRIGVRAWANLTSFQASTGEPAEALQPFIDWYQDISSATTSQYRLAKTEAESDFARAKATGAVGITDALLGFTISANQVHIAATLVDALAGLKRAVRAAKTLPAALQLVGSSCFWKPFVPFDARERRLFGALREALEVVKVAIDVKNNLSEPVDSQHSSEESQDYGDLDALEELAGTETVSRPAQSEVCEILHEPLAQLMSNVFGADQAVDEDIYTKLIDQWVRLAAESVRSGLRSWSSYLESYSAHSWHQLRDTDQKRRLTPYFLAKVVEQAEPHLEDVAPFLFEGWIVCLLEREALLKHQHVLTSSLLDKMGDHPLLDNLPFARDLRAGVHSISLHELRQRRLGLISSLLSNMRTHIESLTFQRSRRQEVERMYSDLLRAMMQAMKVNHQELQSTDQNMGSNVNPRGAYVDFVQQVVTFLHAASIVKVDSFFTDSSVFPLPAGDPTYVVGRLKAYVPKLANVGTQKALAIAIQSISERAAVDGEQTYFVRQLLSAMDEGPEPGDQSRPSLRHVMLTAIFPAYIGQALSTASSWLMAVPVLEACDSIVGGLIYKVRLEDEHSLAAATEVMHLTLIALLEPLHFALERVGRLRLPHVQRILALVFGVGRSMLRLSGHFKRSKGLGASLIEALDNMRVIALEIKAQISDDDETWFSGLPHSISAPSNDSWAETRHYAQASLAKSFEVEWSARDGQYFLTKHNISKEVVVNLRSDEEEQQALLQAITRFVHSFGVVIDGRRRNRRAAAGNAGSSSMWDGVII